MDNSSCGEQLVGKCPGSVNLLNLPMCRVAVTSASLPDTCLMRQTSGRQDKVYYRMPAASERWYVFRCFRTLLEKLAEPLRPCTHSCLDRDHVILTHPRCCDLESRYLQRAALPCTCCISEFWTLSWGTSLMPVGAAERPKRIASQAVLVVHE